MAEPNVPGTKGPRAATAGPAQGRADGRSEVPPTVVCDDLNVVYRVVGSTGAGSAAATVRRILRRRSSAPVFKRIHAVRGVSFVARQGDAIGLIGRNGSGKSTLLRAIAGLLPPETGAVYTAGRPTLLGVNAALMRDLPGEDNIMLGCMAMGMSREQALARRNWIVEFADLGEFIEFPMNTYSSGMAARLRFAIAASMSHEILMIDEALATGDAEFRRRSENRIKELREDAGTVFLVSHSLGVVRLTCNRAIWLEKGQIVMDGDANEVVDAYEAMYDPELEKQERKARRAARKRKREGEDLAAALVAEQARAARESGESASGGSTAEDDLTGLAGADTGLSAARAVGAPPAQDAVTGLAAERAAGGVVEDPAPPGSDEAVPEAR